MRRKTYDPSCYQLAELFMRDQQTEDEKTYREACHSLACHIQESIEDWFSTLREVQKKSS